MTTLSILVRVCILIQSFPKLKVVGELVGSLELCSLDCSLVIVLWSLFVGCNWRVNKC